MRERAPAPDPCSTPFLGRAALERQKAEGVRRRLACFVVDDPAVLLHGSEPIWRVTSQSLLQGIALLSF